MRPNQPLQCAWRLGSLVVMLALAGCGGGTGTLTGKVTLNDHPVGGGTVTFFSPGKGNVVADIHEDGSYTAENLPAGDVKVAVETESAKPVTMSPRANPGHLTPPTNAELPPGADSSIYKTQAKKGKYVKIPDKYGD